MKHTNMTIRLDESHVTYRLVHICHPYQQSRPCGFLFLPWFADIKATFKVKIGLKGYLYQDLFLFWLDFDMLRTALQYAVVASLRIH